MHCQSPNFYAKSGFQLMYQSPSALYFSGKPLSSESRNIS